jgi:hypothetical protein
MGEYHGPVSRSASLEIYSKWALTNRDQFRLANERGSEVLGCYFKITGTGSLIPRFDGRGAWPPEMLKKLKQRAIQALCASIPNHGTGAVEVPVPSHEPRGDT